MLEKRVPLRMVAAGQSQRVEPERLHLHRLADARRDHPVADLRVHPGQLHAGHAAGEQAVRRRRDAVARAALIAGEDRLDAWRRVGRASASSAGSLRAASRNSCTTMTYQSEASTELYSGSSPWSGKRLGNMPCETVPAHAVRISRASPAGPWPGRGRAWR